jgi:hypothetical protein
MYAIMINDVTEFVTYMCRDISVLTEEKDFTKAFKFFLKQDNLMSVNTYVDMYRYVCMCVRACVRACVFVCLYVCMYLCIYVDK